MKTIKTLSFLLSLFFFVVFSTHAQIVYKLVQPDGTVSYFDHPVEGAIKIDLSKVGNTVIPSQSSAQPSQTKPNTPSQVTEDFKVVILFPSDGQTIRDNQGNIRIKASTAKGFSGKYVLTRNEQLYESTSGDFLLENLERGVHEIQVSLVARSGKIIASSKKQRFYLHKTSIINKPMVNR